MKADDNRDKKNKKGDKILVNCFHNLKLYYGFDHSRLFYENIKNQVMEQLTVAIAQEVTWRIYIQTSKGIPDLLMQVRGRGLWR